MGKKQKYSFEIPVEKKEKRKKKQKPLTDIPTSDYVISSPTKFDPVLIKGHSFYGDGALAHAPVNAWAPTPRSDALQQAGDIASGHVQPSTAPAVKSKGRPALVAKRSKAVYSFVDASSLSTERGEQKALAAPSALGATNATSSTLPRASKSADTTSNHTEYNVTYRRPGGRPASKAELREEALVKRWSSGFHSNVDIPLSLTLEKEVELDITHSARSSGSTENATRAGETTSSAAATVTLQINVNKAAETNTAGLPQVSSVSKRYVEETEDDEFNRAYEDEIERVQTRTTVSTTHASNVSITSSESDADGDAGKGSSEILLDAKQVKKVKKKSKFGFKKSKSKDVPEPSTPPSSPTPDTSRTTFILQRPPSSQQATLDEPAKKSSTEQLEGSSAPVETKKLKTKAPEAPKNPAPQASSDSGGGGWFSLSASGVFSKGTSNAALSRVPEEEDTSEAMLTQPQDVMTEAKKGNKSKKVAMKSTKKKTAKGKTEASAYEETMEAWTVAATESTELEIESKKKPAKSSKKTKSQDGHSAKKTTVVVSRSRTMDDLSSQSDDSDKVSTKSAPVSMAIVGKKSKKTKKNVKHSSKKTKSSEDDHSAGSSGTTSTLKVERTLVLAELDGTSTEKLTETKKSKKSVTKHSKKNTPKNADPTDITVPPLVNYDVHGPMSQEELDDIVTDTKKAKQVKSKFNRIRQKKMTRTSLNEADLAPLPGTPTTALLNLKSAEVTSHDNTGFDDNGTINIVTTTTTTGNFVFDQDSDGDGTDGLRIVRGSRTGGPVLLLSGMSHNEADDDDDFSPQPMSLVNPDWMHLT